jgi:predicted O-methyltransferase YrrM
LDFPYLPFLLFCLPELKRLKSILEIGTYTGYSAICLAEGLTKDGLLHTIDINEELTEIQRKFFDQSEFGDKIIQHPGDALKIIPELDQVFDLVFIDAEKKMYDAYFEAVIEKTRPGSIILTDNVLWSGKVVEPLDKKDMVTPNLLAYNKKLKNDPRVETVILSIRDGLTLCRVL